MTKKDFVQRATVSLFPFADLDPAKAIKWAERLWERLSEQGYGAPKREGPREGEDWYAKLAPEQRQAFNRFWDAFRLKQGRNGAAMRWAQIDPSAELAERLVEAARREAQKAVPTGQSRKMAQGWLQERRWEDQAPTQAANPADTQAHRLRQLYAELATLERLDQGRGTLAAQITAKRAEIDSLCPTPPKTSPPPA